MNAELLPIVIDKPENLMINEGERSFILFNLTRNVNTRYNFIIYTSTNQQGVSSEYTGGGMTHLQANTITSGDWVIEMHILLINGDRDLDQTEIFCKYQLIAMPRIHTFTDCNVTIPITVLQRGKGLC